MLNLNNGVLKTTKKHKSKIGVPFVPRVGDGVAKETKKNERKGFPLY